MSNNNINSIDNLSENSNLHNFNNIYTQEYLQNLLKSYQKCTKNNKINHNIKQFYDFIIINNLNILKELENINYKYNDLNYKYDGLQYKIYLLNNINIKLNKHINVLINILILCGIINIIFLFTFYLFY
jgi:hypothetical protein